MSKYKDIYDACSKICHDKVLDVIVDLGSRHGEGYDLFGTKHPDSEYVFVEPSPRCISNIESVIRKNEERKLRLIRGILGKERKEVNFYQLDHDNDQSGNLFSDREGIYGKANLLKVQMYDFRKEFEHIDFLKCNIEGGEFDLIDAGFFDIVDCFVMEAHNRHVPNKTYRDVIEKLSSKFELEVWGNTSYKYCFVNGIKKN
jgi:FkbM family methyltransferase